MVRRFLRKDYGYGIKGEPTEILEGLTQKQQQVLRTLVKKLGDLRAEAFIHAGDKKAFDKIIAEQDKIKEKMAKLTVRYDLGYKPSSVKWRDEHGFLKRAGLNPHVHTKIQLKKMTKTGLIRLVIKLEKFIVNHAYEMYKAKLPRLRTRPQLKKLGFTEVPLSKMRGKMLHGVYVPPQQLDYARKLIKKHKTKRKKLTGAAKAKFLARMNKGRRKKGLKPIRSR